MDWDKKHKSLSFRDLNLQDFINNEPQPSDNQMITKNQVGKIKDTELESSIDLACRHPFTSGVCKTFDKKNIAANFDWATILMDIKKKLPYLSVLVILVTIGAIYFTHSKWEEKQAYFSKSQLLYNEVKFESKQVLPTSTSLAMIQHKELLEKALSSLPEYKTISNLKASVNVNFDKKSKLVSIEVNSKNKQEAIDTANILSDLVIEASQNFYYRYFQEKFSNLSKQVKLTEQDMLVQDRMITEAMKKNGAINTRQQYRIIMESMSLQERNLLEARIDQKKQEVQLEVLKNEYAKMPDEVIRNSYEDNPLKAQLTNTKMALLSAQSIYGEGNPNIMAIKEKIAGLKKQLASQDIQSTLQKVYMPNLKKQEVYMEIARAEGQLKSASNRIYSIMANLEQQKKELYAVPEKEMKLDDTLRKREATAKLLDVLRKKQQDVEIMMRSEIKDLKLYEQADQASLIQPVKLLAVAPGAFIFSLIVSALYLLVKCVLDQSIKTKKHLDINFTIPCVVQLVDSHNTNKHLFNEFTNLVGIKANQNSNNIICLQSKDECHAADDLVELLAVNKKKVLLCTFGDIQEIDDSTEEKSKAWDLSFENDKAHDLIDKADVLMDGKEIPLSVLDRLKALSFEYDFIIVSLPSEEIQKTYLGLINFSDWYFYVVDACQTKRANLVKKLKEMEFKGVCPEGFILDRVKESFLQV